VWYGSTVASLSREVRKLCEFYLDKTYSDKSNIDFMLHDFGYRGATTNQSAVICGAAHLLNFKGTDTIPSLTLPYNSYNAKEMPGFSVEASEHSVMTALGKDDEYEQAAHVINSADEGILSVVIDSYDYRNFLETIFDGVSPHSKAMFEFLESSENNKIVFRPDSGDPVSTTLDVFNIIGKHIDTPLNEGGYKVLPPNFGVLWGDGLNYHKIRDILFALKSNMWAASNIVFGMGGGLHTAVNRDTQRTAFKSSAQCRDGKWHDIYKEPLDSTKKSKRGKLALIKNNNDFITEQVPYGTENKDDYLRTVFKNGKLLIDDNWEDVRERALYKNEYK
jgi:nicotinamide phosphoribosyltransferase